MLHLQSSVKISQLVQKLLRGEEKEADALHDDTINLAFLTNNKSRFKKTRTLR
jgi:hypothetical protein